MAAALIVILFDTNLTTIANAQQQQQPSNQTSATENSTLFQSTTDNFRVQVPEGWIIRDVDNTGATLAAEVLEGYGVLAQLCPQDQQQAVPDAVANNSSGSICRGSEGDIVHILRYPDLGARVGFTSDDNSDFDFDNAANTILSYQIQKLQEVGYRDIQIVNSTDTTYTTDISTAASGMIDNDNTDALPSSVEAPAKLVEMTYSTSFAPNELRRGYYLLTATTATSPNVETLTGYGIFYEGNSAASAAADTITTTPPSDSLASTTSLPAPVILVFDSFELIASEEMVQAALAALAAQAQQLGQVEQAQEVEEEPISPLAGQFFSSSTEGIAPATIEFAAVISGGSGQYTINWDFGDGSEEESDNDEDIAHTFEEAGTYTVTVIATDSAGQVVSDSIVINVEEAPAEEEQQAPAADEVVEEEVEEEQPLPPAEEEEVEEDNDAGSDNPLFDDDDNDPISDNPLFDDDDNDPISDNPLFDDDDNDPISEDQDNN